MIWSWSSITEITITKAALSSQYSSVEATTVILGGKGFSPFVFYFNGKEASGEAEKPWTRVVFFSNFLKTEPQLWRLKTSRPQPQKCSKKPSEKTVDERLLFEVGEAYLATENTISCSCNN